MSKLVIKDLERIKNGKIVKFNLLTKEKYNSYVVLDRIQKEIIEFVNTRFNLFREFRKDMNDKLDWVRGSKIDNTYRVSFDLNKVFIDKYMILTIPTIFGDSDCLFDENGFVSSTGEIDDELIKKCQIIAPCVQKMFEIKNKCNVTNNEFYNDYGIYNSLNEKVFNINGNGVTLPFNDYSDCDDLQAILSYYYNNQEEILRNIIIPNTEALDNYRLNINRDKVLKLYKGEK